MVHRVAAWGTIDLEAKVVGGVRFDRDQCGSSNQSERE